MEKDLRSLVVKNDQETFKDNSKLDIELLFLNVPGFKEKHFNYENVLGGGNVYKFKGDKREFAENLEILESKYFENFKPLFEMIESIIAR